MKQSAEATACPAEQTMVRQETIAQEHRAALERAVSLKVPHAVTPGEEAGEESVATTSHDQDEGSTQSESKSSARTNWNELVEKLFNRSESGNLVLKKDINVGE